MTDEKKKVVIFYFEDLEQEGLEELPKVLSKTLKNYGVEAILTTQKLHTFTKAEILDILKLGFKDMTEIEN